MKRILGLDLGTNSIGWALIEQDFENKQGEILGLGSRIIPMDAGDMGKFAEGGSISQTADRTRYRGVRRLRERHLLRRERLHRVLNVLNFLPKSYASQIDFENRLGQFLDETEPKLAWKKNGTKANGKDQFEFLFLNSFDEMVADFKANGQDIKIPYDWTIYYLRKKALTHKIRKEELAWVILNFNQKRGYYQLRGEDFDKEKDRQFVALKVEKIIDSREKVKGKSLFDVYFDNGWKYDRQITNTEPWVNKTKEFIVTESILKSGEVKRTFKAVDSEKDWIAIKTKTEQEISSSRKTVGTYIYENLLKNPNQKIRGKLVRTIERKFYRDELNQILEKQIELQPELFTDDLYNDCVRELYRSNEAHRMQLSKRDFVHLFVNDIIFYQRPLKSQKSSIGNCALEHKTFKDKDGNEQTMYLKAIPKSNPYYQEFRVWQWLYNLKIYIKENDKDVTAQFIRGIKDMENLFEFLMSKNEVNHIDLLTYFLEPTVREKFPNAKGKALKNEIFKEIGNYRWNYVYDVDKDESKKYPMNDTSYEIRKRLEKVKDVPKNFLTRKAEQHLWHIIYSVTDKIEFETALETFAKKYRLYHVPRSAQDAMDPDKGCFVENFKKFKPFDSDYGRYSEKAIKRLLPLLRVGKYWSWDKIDEKTKIRIDKIITGEYDEEVKDRVREKAIRLTEENHFQGLQLWLAQYIAYNRHSEANIAGKWNSVSDLEQYLKDFKQHSLRNPIVEQIITETLRVVKDIWILFGKGAKDYFDEIHIELGRDMKNPADKRKHLSNIISENENTNFRIKAILSELINDHSVQNVRPYSPMQQQTLKIYEDGVLNSEIEIPDEIEKISKKSKPTKAEIQRYKLWLEQKYKSPYTGRPIPLGKLFTSTYEIEHIIPQSRFFDDSFSNKVICEAEVNSLKGNQLGLEFIINHHGQKVPTSFGEVEILSEEAYKDFVKKHYDRNREKKKKLLLEEIPQKMIERQLNDTRYIGKFVSNLLSNIVRAEKNDEGINSKNIIPGNGKITGRLKQDWGLNDVWNDLILPRFERMNQLTNSADFTAWNEKYQKFLPTVPLELSKDFQKKRIDHRHHALDALVIACATSDHINLLNNKHAKSKNERYDLQHKLRNKEKWQDKNGNEKDKFIEFKKPWNNFTVDAKNELEKVVVSFKQNLRVINKATNHYEKIVNGKKIKVEQKGVNWAIRKPMHKETVSGLVDLPHIKAPNGKILTATRKSLDTSFNTKNIESITDTGIQKILINHLSRYDEPKIEINENDITKVIAKRIQLIKDKQLTENPELAFSPEGIEDMNKDISLYNDGKQHQPILKVRVFELGSKFLLGDAGNKTKKFVEAAKGTNLFFVVYQKKDTNERIFETVPLNEVIEFQKQQVLENVSKENRTEIPIKKILEFKNKSVEVEYLFHLSPNDLVYIPNEDDGGNIDRIGINNLSKGQVNKIYKMVSSTGRECHFVQANIASLIKSYDAKTKIGELGSLNKLEVDVNNTVRIKESCIKLKVDRLGNIQK